MAISITAAVLTVLALYTLQYIAKCIYNITLHPLRKYPGPLLWRASAIPKNWCWITGNIGHAGVALHEKYGAVVRIAPNELSYIEPQAWRDIFGRSSGRREMIKDPSFFGQPVDGAYNLVTAPTDDHSRSESLLFDNIFVGHGHPVLDEHVIVRKLFSPAFSNTALVAQEPLLAQYAAQMATKMGEAQRRDGNVDVVDFFNFATFDIMAELAFGESLGMLEKTDYVPWVRIIFDGLKYVVFRAVLLEIPLLGPLLNWATASTLRAKAEEHAMFARNLVDKRLDDNNRPSDKPDLWSFVLKHSDDGKGLTKNEMYNNASTFMVAGTETTATTLSGVVYYLGRHPKIYKKLVAEIRSTFKTSSEIALGPLSEMVYLNAVLKEGLRLYVPGGGGMTRIVPPEGAEICGDFVTGGTAVTMNHYPAYRHESNFARPKEFLPERWIATDDPAFASDRRDVYEPFSYGPRNCIGKNLAWLELRLLLTMMLWHYDFELLPGNVGWTDQKSYLTWEKGPLLAKLYSVKK